MPQRDHSSVLPAEPQSPADLDWQRLVEQRLPADLEAQAKELKAFVRVRGLPSALHLLRGLLYYVLSHASLREVSVWSRLIGLTSKVISGQAWHQRLLASADWLLWLFNALLAAPKGSFGEHSQRILLVDATHVSCRDKRADTWRLHTAYDLVRYSAAHLPLYAPDAPASTREHRVDVLAWLRTLPPGLYERRAMVVEQEHCLPVRLIALVLPDDQAEALRRQKQRQARDNGRTLSPEA